MLCAKKSRLAFMFIKTPHPLRMFYDSGNVLCAAFTPDQRLLASGASDCTCMVWNLMTGTASRSLEHQAPVVQCTWSPCAQRLLTAR